MGSLLMEPVDVEAYANICHPQATPGNHSLAICLSPTMIQSRGIFHHRNPLDYSLPLVLLQLSIASFFILFTSRLLKPLGQPNTVIQILVSINIIV